MTEKEMLHNQILAEETVDFNRTITVVCDERPGFEINEARRIINHLRENGYNVMEKDVDNFLATNTGLMGFLLVIPHASSLPAVCALHVRNFLERGGSVLTLGGVLFGKCVERIDGKWVETELPPHIFDAVHSGDETKPEAERVKPKAERIVIEGIVPTYKTYRCNDAKDFESNTFYTNANLETKEPLKVICPVPRAYGGGYNMGVKNRYIPIVKINGNSDRGDGNEGAAAFIMLNDTVGHNPVGTNFVYPGTVVPTASGSVAANIGIMDQNLMDIKGVPELLLSIVDNLCRGLHIFNAGASKYVYSEGEKAVFGAKIHNSTVDYLFATIHISVEKEGKVIYEFEEELLCAHRSYAECSFDCENFKADEYTVKTELIYNGEVIDTVSQEIHKKEVINATDKNDFVTVDGENFKLGGELWYPVGFNYWPLYTPSLERNDYWYGWLDKTNYIPEEVEKDLCLMEKMGINCLFLRMDGDMIGRQKVPFEDFLYRLRRHNIKLCMSFCNVSTPIHYNGRAFKKIIEELCLINDPVIFSHDISWESDGGILATPYKRRYDTEWEKWLVDRYGSVENAERDFGMKVDRRADGQVTVPDEEKFAIDGEWRIKTNAYRRFMEDYWSKKWRVAVEDIKKFDPNHLVSYRRGPLGPTHCKGAKIAIKHTDYNSHEAYHITLGEEGYHNACINAALFKWLSKNKPIVWAEYGLTLTGMNRTNDFVWDHEKERPMDFRMKMTEEYNRQMQKAFKRTGAKGTAPWWWAGGLRMVEMSDCGYCEPDGKLRSFGKDYAKFIKEYFIEGEKKPLPTYKVLADLNLNGRGVEGLCESLIEADIEAEKQNAVLELYSEATGTTSANTPLTAIGNVEFNGTNPPKHLNGEFNYVKIICGDKVINVENGDTVNVGKEEVFIESSLGNLKEATWLSPLTNSETNGCVYVVSHPSSDIGVKIPIAKDAPYLEDTYCEKALLCSKVDGELNIALRLSAENRADFGEVFRFTLKNN